MLLARLLAYATAASILAGCAIGRDTVDVSAPRAATPAGNKFVRIDSVADKRQFQVSPPSADIASLDPDADASDQTKARAIGRKRGGFGKALGDVVLPEGKTVSGLVEGAVASGFQEAGYVVVKKGDANFDSAPAVNAQVIEFWAWFQPGFWAVTTNHKSELKLTGDSSVLRGEKTVMTRVSESKQIVTTDDWREIVEKGLAAITEQTRKMVSP